MVDQHGYGPKYMRGVRPYEVQVLGKRPHAASFRQEDDQLFWLNMRLRREVRQQGNAQPGKRGIAQRLAVVGGKAAGHLYRHLCIVHPAGARLKRSRRGFR